MACEIHLGDIGTVFRLTIVDCNDVAIDISTATIRNVTFKKPDGSTAIKAGVFYTNGTDGIIDYTTLLDDLDMVGAWKIQAKVTLSTGAWSSDIGDFIIYGNL